MNAIKPNYWIDDCGFEHIETCRGTGCPMEKQCGRVERGIMVAGSECRGHRRADGLWECTSFARKDEMPPDHGL